MSRSPDVVVIGGGLVGTMTALGLSEAGVRVTLLEADFEGSGSTGAAMGHIVAMDDSPEQLTLCEYSRRRWGELAPSLPANGEVDRCGTLWIAATDEEMSVGQERVRGYAARRIAAELVDSRGLRELEPALRQGLPGGVRVPGDAVCYPPAIARALSERVAAAGGVVKRHAKAVSLAAHEVTLADGSAIATDAIVVAAGVSSPDLVPSLPIVPRKGHLVITDRRPAMVHHQLVELGYMTSAHTFGSSSVAFNVQPRRTGQLLIGSSRELVGFDPSINHQLLNSMLQRAIDFVPGLAQVRALRSWVGFRPATADKLPLIGRWPAIDGVWIAAGHEGLGITMSTGTADLIVAGITGAQPPIDPAPFLPDRPMRDMAHAA